MFSKIIFVLAMVCVVNASVLTVNVFDDDPESQDASNPKDCNFQECDQLCRRLKFPGGACVNGQCKCDNFLNAEDETENTLSYLEDSVLQKDDLETEVKANPSRCNLRVCGRVCRWLNKTGSCVDGRCKCANSIVAEDEAAMATSPKKCIFRACYSQCRSGNYISGACVNGRCKCSKSSNTKGEGPESLYNLEDTVLQQDDPETEVENKKSDCNNQACDQLCRRLQFPGGACVNGRCQCDNFLNAEVFAESLSNPEDSISPRPCNNQKCYDLCRKIKLRGGACIDGKCNCNKYLSEQDDTMTDSAESLPLSSCNSIACDDRCRRTGWHSGVCINGQCKCDYFLNTEDAVTGNTLSNLEDSISPRRCTYEACNELCRRHKFTGGTCVSSRCKCDNFLGTEDPVDEYSEFAPIRVCRFTKCNRKCTRRGYKNATCVNGRCKCYNILEEKDEIFETPLPVSVLSEDQSERGCNFKACEQLCHKLKLPGGACVNGRCKCDDFSETEDAVDEYSELATRFCNLRECNRTCKSRGYQSARCDNGLCKCYNF